MSREYVDRVKNHFDRLFQEGITPWTEHDLETEVVQFSDFILDKYPEPLVLDIGCGDGWISIYFLSKGIRVIGIDSSPTAIAKAKKDAREAGLEDKAVFETGDGLSLPYEDGKFEAVFDRGFFHHVPEDEYDRYLKEVDRVIKQGGYLSLHAFTKRNRRGIGHMFSGEDIERIFSQGFEILKASEDAWPSEAPAHLGHYLMRKKAT
jgi:cyclopropane fatty-acyl-phospholipid synthase-like methyltransferase